MSHGRLGKYLVFWCHSNLEDVLKRLKCFGPVGRSNTSFNFPFLSMLKSEKLKPFEKRRGKVSTSVKQWGVITVKSMTLYSGLSNTVLIFDH